MTAAPSRKTRMPSSAVAVNVAAPPAKLKRPVQRTEKLSTGSPTGPPAPQTLLMVASHAVRVAGPVGVVLLKYSARNCPAGQRVTTTVMLVVAVRPTPSRTNRLSLWLPVEYAEVSQPNVAAASAPNVEKTSLPSMLSVKVIGVLNAPRASISTLVEPLTATPSAGRKNEATSGGTTVTVRLPRALAPGASGGSRIRGCAPARRP